MALNVKVRYFAVARDWAGRSAEDCSFADGTTTDAVWDHLIRLEPRFGAWRGRLRLAVNDEYIVGSVALRSGDEVSVIPPVSGG